MIAVMNFESDKNVIAGFSIKNKRIRVSGKKLISTWEGVEKVNETQYVHLQKNLRFLYCNFFQFCEEQWTPCTTLQDEINRGIEIRTHVVTRGHRSLPTWCQGSEIYKVTPCSHFPTDFDDLWLIRVL